MTLAALREAPLAAEGGFASVEVRDTLIPSAWRLLRLELVRQGFAPVEPGQGQSEALARGDLRDALGSEHVAQYAGGVVIYSRAVYAARQAEAA